MTVLVSFSLYGTDPEDIYYQGAIENVWMYNYWQPEWKLRFYVGRSVPLSISDRLLADGMDQVEIIDKSDQPEDHTATYWRFLALRDHQWSHFLFRDCDSRPIVRERAAVDEWMASKEHQYHTMRDHPWHGVPMLSGLWGCTQRGAGFIRKNVTNSIDGDYYQVDQRWLRKNCWRQVRRSLMAHIDHTDLFFERKESIRPFPVEIDPNEGFVGQGWYGSGDMREPEHLQMVLDWERDVSQKAS